MKDKITRPIFTLIKGIILLILFCIASCSPDLQEGKIVWLDGIPFHEVFDVYGPPVKNMSYSRDSMRIAGTTYTIGISVHAPSKLHVNLKGKAILFGAMVGVDDAVLNNQNKQTAQKNVFMPSYIYNGSANLTDFKQGGTVVFKLIGDGNQLWTSGTMRYGQKPQKVEVPLEGINHLELVAESAGDGTYFDIANWVNAYITAKDSNMGKELFIYNRSENILVNHAGFKPNGFKQCVVPDTSIKEFLVMDAVSHKSMFSGKLIKQICEFGTFSKGDFSNFTKEGKYYLQSISYKSEEFKISEKVYDECIKLHLNAFNLQRAGDPNKGWAKGKHLDDGKRKDNKKHKDVTGGWYDACDLRKWAYTIVGLNGLCEIASQYPDANLKNELMENIRWGNKYFLSMQEELGYIMNHVGGDINGVPNENRWSDNILNNADDRIIDTDPADLIFQYIFIISELKIANLTKDTDPKYSMKCLKAAENCFEWTDKFSGFEDPYILGAEIEANVLLFKILKNTDYQKNAIKLSKVLLYLQEKKDKEIAGFFYNNHNLTTPSHQLYQGDWPIWGLLSLIENFQKFDEKESILKALDLHFSKYVKTMTAKNSFSLVPYSLYAIDPGGKRKMGNFYYRWAYINNEKDEWWNGINPHIASKGISLIRYANYSKNQSYRQIAQRQLDWIYGCNPFNASTVTGIGKNQPALFKTNEFAPPTPLIDGAVMAGIGTNHNDALVLLPGWWQTCEYWTPPLIYTMWLASIL